MGIRLFLLGKVPAFIASTGVALILSTKPDDVLDNVRIWSVRLGLDHPPAWTQTETFAAYAPSASIALLCTVMAWLVWSAVSWVWHRSRDRRAARRVFVPASMSLSALVKPFKSHTQMDADSLTAKYLGCWMRIKGSVAQANKLPRGGVLLVHTEHIVLGPRAEMFFSRRQAGKAAMLNRGAPFVAVGRIATIGYSHVLLDACEIEG